MGSESATQDAVFAFLADSATHGGRTVRRIDTHAAVVFLAGDRAFKIKRAVRFPFLDYSTLERRHAACIAELEINQPIAPALYLRVFPITRATDGRLALNGSGEPAVRCARRSAPRLLRRRCSMPTQRGARILPKPRRSISTLQYGC